MTTPASVNEFNLNLINEFRANQGKVTGIFQNVPVLLLTTTGAKSGEQRTTPLVYTKDGDNFVIIASMGGAPRHPAWYFNILANPEVTLEVGTEKFAATATAHTEGPEHDRLYAQQAAMMPQFNQYQANTTRKIPAVTLARG